MRYCKDPCNVKLLEWGQTGEERVSLYCLYYSWIRNNNSVSHHLASQELYHLTVFVLISKIRFICDPNQEKKKSGEPGTPQL